MACTRWRAESHGCRSALAALGVVAMLAVGVVAAEANAEPAGRIERIDLKTDASATKVIIMLSRPLPFDVRVLDGEAARKSAQRLVLDFENTTLAPATLSPLKVEDGFVQQIRTGRPAAGTARIVLDLAHDTKHSVEAYETPPHVTIAISARSAAASGATDTPR